MNHFYIIMNTGKEKTQETARLIKDYLVSKGKTCEYQEKPPGFKFGRMQYTNPELIPEETECVITIGGDGTLIQAARDLMGRNLPLLGVNLGTLGYLVEIDKHNILPALDRAVSGNFKLVERMMIRGTILHKGRKQETDAALNDVVISRNGSLRIINYHIYVNGRHLNSYQADGIIVSTPTGSTGYSMSAGGPIVEPGASMFVITPICPHNLNTRSIVLSGNETIEIEIGPGRKTEIEEAEATFDGNRIVAMSTGDRIIIKKAEEEAKTIKMDESSFLEVLRNKIHR